MGVRARAPAYHGPGLTGCYRDFRREVKSTIGMDDAVVVQVPGLWLAIEADGYTHS